MCGDDVVGMTTAGSLHVTATSVILVWECWLAIHRQYNPAIKSIRYYPGIALLTKFALGRSEFLTAISEDGCLLGSSIVKSGRFWATFRRLLHPQSAQKTYIFILALMCTLLLIADKFQGHNLPHTVALTPGMLVRSCEWKSTSITNPLCITNL